MEIATRQGVMSYKEMNDKLDELVIVKTKVTKLKQLILLVDDSVSNVEMNELSSKQWMEFIKVFPDEGA